MTMAKMKESGDNSGSNSIGEDSYKDTDSDKNSHRQDSDKQSHRGPLIQPLTSSLTKQRRMRDNGQEKRDMQEAKAPAQEERTRSIKKESKDVG